MPKSKSAVEVMACPFCDGEACRIALCRNGTRTIFCQTCKSRCFISELGYKESHTRKKISCL
jgi:hypothetical protein